MPLSALFKRSAPPAGPSPMDEALAHAACFNSERRVLEAVAQGGDPTRVVRTGLLGSLSITAFEEAIRHHNAPMMEAFLSKGFRPSLSEVERAVRAVEMQDDFDGHPGEMPEGHEVIRVLFRHGERFDSSSHDPHHPTETLADHLRRHAPSLGLDWTTPAATPLPHRPERPAARTDEERAALTRHMGIYAGSQSLVDIDVVRHLWARGGDVMHIPREVGPSKTLVQIALGGSHTTLLKFCLQQGLLPTDEDKATLVKSLLPAISEDDEWRSNGPRLTSTHACVRVLLAAGETFQGPGHHPRHPEWTAADVIRAYSPILTKELPAAREPSPPDLPAPTPEVTPERRHRRPR